MNEHENDGKTIRWVVAAAAVSSLLILAFSLVFSFSYLWYSCGTPGGQGPSVIGSCNQPVPNGIFVPSPKALDKSNPFHIPTQDLLNLYQAAGQRFDVPWPVLAGIANSECSHGQNPDPACHSSANSAGAMGPMQFLQGTWDAYKVAAPGHSTPNIYDMADAVYSAANYLAHNGAAGVTDLSSPSLRAAIWQYNHLNSYVDGVLAAARSYIQPVPQSFGTVLRTIGFQPLFSWVPKTGFPGAGNFTDAVDQCTYYAAFQWPGINGQGVTWKGDAGTWLQSAISQGFQVTSTPIKGAIAVWAAQPGYSQFGHVAIVTDVSSTSYTVSEQNFNGPGVVDQRTIPWPDTKLAGFIPIPAGVPGG